MASLSHGHRGSTDIPVGLSSLLVPDPYGAALSAESVYPDASSDLGERSSRRRKRTAGQQDYPPASKVVEAIRAAAKLALMGNQSSIDVAEEEYDDGDDEEEGDDGDLDDEERSSKRRKTDETGPGGKNYSKWKIKKPGSTATPQTFVTEEEKKARKRESNNVKKVKERQRRSKMSESIHELRRLLPQCRDDKKANQSIVMMRAVEYICHLERQLELSLAENHRLKAMLPSSSAVLSVPDARREKEVGDASRSGQFGTGPVASPGSDSAVSSILQAVSLSDSRPPNTTSHGEPAPRASKASAFAPPARPVPNPAFALPAPHKQTHVPTSNPFELPKYPMRENVDPLAKDSPSPMWGFGHHETAAQNPQLGAPLPYNLQTAKDQYHMPSRIDESADSDGVIVHGHSQRVRAAKAAHHQPEVSQKHPSWSSKSLPHFSHTMEPVEPDLHATHDIEEVDGEWPLFFQRPYLNSSLADFSHDHHLPLAPIRQHADPFNSFPFDSAPHPSHHDSHDIDPLDFGHSTAR